MNYHAQSMNNLESIRKLPQEYSNLRQTLNFKVTDFDNWNYDEENQKSQKPTNINILRQTMSSKMSFKPKN